MRTVIILASLLGIWTADATKTSPRQDCFCTMQYDPVCACKREQLIEYPNWCSFNCANDKDAVVVFNGLCKEYAFQKCDADCPKTFQPVCASDGKEYSSDCSVKCHRIFLDRTNLRVMHQGRCERRNTYTPQ